MLHEKQELLIAYAKLKGVKKRIDEISEYLKSVPADLTEYDEGMVRKYIDQIKVQDDQFIVCFKAKVEIVVPR